MELVAAHGQLLPSAAMVKTRQPITNDAICISIKTFDVFLFSKAVSNGFIIFFFLHCSVYVLRNLCIPTILTARKAVIYPLAWSLSANRV